MDLNSRVDVNFRRKDGRTDGLTDGRTENWTPISHLAKAGATIMLMLKHSKDCFYKQVGEVVEKLCVLLHQRFSDGETAVADKKRPGRPKFSNSNELENGGKLYEN